MPCQRFRNTISSEKLSAPGHKIERARARRSTPFCIPNTFTMVTPVDSNEALDALQGDKSSDEISTQRAEPCEPQLPVSESPSVASFAHRKDPCDPQLPESEPPNEGTSDHSEALCLPQLSASEPPRIVREVPYGRRLPTSDLFVEAGFAPQTAGHIGRNKRKADVLDIIDMALNVIDDDTHCHKEEPSRQYCPKHHHSEDIYPYQDHDHTHQTTNNSHLHPPVHDHPTGECRNNSPRVSHEESYVREVIAQNDRLNREVTEIFGLNPLFTDGPMNSREDCDYDPTRSYPGSFKFCKH